VHGLYTDGSAAEACNCFVARWDAHCCLTFCFSQDTGQQPQQHSSRSEGLSLDIYIPKSRLPKQTAHLKPATTRLNGIAYYTGLIPCLLSKPHKLPLLRCLLHSFKPFSRLLLGRAHVRKQNEYFPLPSAATQPQYSSVSAGCRLQMPK
jgi:hypothetical protein